MIKLFIFIYKYYYLITIIFFIIHGYSYTHKIQTNKIIKKTIITLQLNHIKYSIKNKIHNQKKLFTIYKPNKIGDTIIVIIKEHIIAKNNSFTNILQNNHNNFKIQEFPNNICNLNFFKKFIYNIKRQYSHNTNNQFNKNMLHGMITVQINNILSNGNFQISGEKKISVNQNLEVIKCSGIINPNDIDKNNTVLSTKILNLNTKYYHLKNMELIQKKNWFQKLLLFFLSL
ncbi:Flagellar L-ring protein [Buchnera aphidicola (Phyllaphis fagi)]|uniref:flagellar basal body L-ring protein FlgH n=1 Tax=Buchnera aphidicola TaxID=9 RepID=UPI0034639C9D